MAKAKDDNDEYPKPHLRNENCSPPLTLSSHETSSGNLRDISLIMANKQTILFVHIDNCFDNFLKTFKQQLKNNYNYKHIRKSIGIWLFGYQDNTYYEDLTKLLNNSGYPVSIDTCLQDPDETENHCIARLVIKLARCHHIFEEKVNFVIVSNDSDNLYANYNQKYMGEQRKRYIRWIKFTDDMTLEMLDERIETVTNMDFEENDEINETVAPLPTNESGENAGKADKQNETKAKQIEENQESTKQEKKVEENQETTKQENKVEENQETIKQENKVEENQETTKQENKVEENSEEKKSSEQKTGSLNVNKNTGKSIKGRARKRKGK